MIPGTYYVCVCVCVCVCIYYIAHNHAIRPCHPSHSMPLALILCVCVFIKLCVCVCVVIPFLLDISLLETPAGATKEEGHTEFLRLLSAVLVLLFSREEESVVPFPRRP